MRTGANQRPLTPGQGQQSQQESLAAAAAANPALAYTGMPGWCNSHTANCQTIYVLYMKDLFKYMFYYFLRFLLIHILHHLRLSGVGPCCLLWPDWSSGYGPRCEDRSRGASSSSSDPSPHKPCSSTSWYALRHLYSKYIDIGVFILICTLVFISSCSVSLWLC